MPANCTWIALFWTLKERNASPLKSRRGDEPRGDKRDPSHHPAGERLEHPARFGERAQEVVGRDDAEESRRGGKKRARRQRNLHRAPGRRLDESEKSPQPGGKQPGEPQQPVVPRAAAF